MWELSDYSSNKLGVKKPEELDQHNISNIKGPSHSSFSFVHITKLLSAVCALHYIFTKLLFSILSLCYYLFIYICDVAHDLSPPTQKKKPTAECKILETHPQGLW